MYMGCFILFHVDDHWKSYIGLDIVYVLVCAFCVLMSLCIIISGTKNDLTVEVGGKENIMVLRSLKVVDGDLVDALESFPHGTVPGDCIFFISCYCFVISVSCLLYIFSRFWPAWRILCKKCLFADPFGESCCAFFFYFMKKNFLSLKYMLNSIACCVIVNVIIHNDSEWNLCRFGWLSRNFMSNSVEFATCYQCHLTCYVLYLSPKTRLQLFLAANNLCLHHFWVLI